MIGYQKDECRLCGKTDNLNEGICASHSSDAAQGYLFGYADGKKELESSLAASQAREQECADAIQHLLKEHPDKIPVFHRVELSKAVNKPAPDTIALEARVREARLEGAEAALTAVTNDAQLIVAGRYKKEIAADVVNSLEGK